MRNFGAKVRNKCNYLSIIYPLFIRVPSAALCFLFCELSGTLTDFNTCWKYLFENPQLENLSKKDLSNNYSKLLLKYDMIILNDKDLIKNQDIEKLISLLKNDGVIIIENIGRNYIKVAKIFFNNFRKCGIEILDYRFKRFLLNNCILLIKKNNDRNIIKKLKEFFLFLKFIVNENIISFALIIFKK